MEDITRKEYVQGLQKMIRKHGDKACSYCPLAEEFMSDDLPYGTREIEKWCFDFISLNREREGKGCQCPCFINRKAPALARVALALWDKGEHKWQKGFAQDAILKEMSKLRAAFCAPVFVIQQMDGKAPFVDMAATKRFRKAEAADASYAWSKWTEPTAEKLYLAYGKLLEAMKNEGVCARSDF